MTTSKLVRTLLLACSVATPGIVISADPLPVHSPTSARTLSGFDWVQQTQTTLTELKGKLNLQAEQLGAWDVWSQALMQDARLQARWQGFSHSRSNPNMGSSVAESTPDQMARGLSEAHAQIDWMQTHLLQLEAALARTKVFYQALEKNQQTIFDLFWHEIYHRSAGHDQLFDMDDLDEEPSPANGADDECLPKSGLN